MSLSVGLEPRNIARQRSADVSPEAAAPAASPERPTTRLGGGGGALRRGSLRFLDDRVERLYQAKAGAESHAGYQVTTGTAALMWLLAAVIVPSGTPVPLDRGMVVCSAMAVVNWMAFLFSELTDTLDRQHSIVSVLTAVNALVIIALASTGGVLPGYGVSAILLLFAFGFVARTSFIFAAMRSAVIVVGFVVAALLYRGPGNLLVDTFIFGAAVIGTLLALRLLEQSRRRVFFQDIVITEQADALMGEKALADALLLNILPSSISSRLLAGEQTIADGYPDVTVLFADIVGFTQLAGQLPAHEVVGVLDRLFGRFDELVAARGLEKIKTIGDAYMVAGGLPEPIDDHASRVVDLGLAMIDVARQEGGRIGGLQLRVGVHSGPVIGGVIGHRKVAFDVWGETVNIASRLESQGIRGRIRVSDATWQQVRNDFDAISDGPIDLRGYGPIDAYTIIGRRTTRIETRAA